MFSSTECDIDDAVQLPAAPVQDTRQKYADMPRRMRGGARVKNRAARSYRVQRSLGDVDDISDTEAASREAYIAPLDSWSKPPSMPQPSGDTVADAFRYFVQVKRLQERFKDSNVYRFLCTVHNRSGAPMQLLMEDYDLLMDQPDYNALFGELWQLSDSMPAEAQLKSAQAANDMFDDVQDVTDQGVVVPSASTQAAGPSSAGPSSAGPNVGGVNPSVLQTPKKEMPASPASTPGTPQGYKSLQSLQRTLQFTPTKPSPTLAADTLPSDIGEGIAYGAVALGDAIRGSLSTLDSILLSELRRTNNLMPLVAAYEQRKASMTIQRMLQRNAAFEKIVFTPKALGAIDAALRMVSSYPNLRSVQLSQFMRDADARTDFGQLVGLVMLEAATLPNSRGNVYVVTHPRIVSVARSLMMQMRRARIDFAGDVVYETADTGGYGGPSTYGPSTFGRGYPGMRFTSPRPLQLDTSPISIAYI